MDDVDLPMLARLMNEAGLLKECFFDMSKAQVEQVCACVLEAHKQKVRLALPYDDPFPFHSLIDQGFYLHPQKERLLVDYRWPIEDPELIELIRLFIFTHWEQIREALGKNDLPRKVVIRAGGKLWF